MSENRTKAEDLIWLLGYTLRREKPEDMDRLQGMDLAGIYELSRAQGLVAMVYVALESAGFFGDCEADRALLKKWRQEKDKVLRKQILLEAERQEIQKLLEEKGIWYMALKGALLQQMYPAFGLRQMSDVDILFDSRYRGEIKKLMIARGYRVESYGKGNHDAYLKDPVYNIEMHVALMPPVRRHAMESYYENVKDRLVKDTANQMGYHFTEEDFYVFLVAHMYKHVLSGGTGLRSLADIYVCRTFMQGLGINPDCEYVQGELEKLGISAFHGQVSSLADRIFTADYEIASKDREQLEVYLRGGTYGCVNTLVENRMAFLAEDGVTGELAKKVKYCFARLFPDMDFYRVYVPFVYRHRVLIPLYLPYRYVRGFFVHRKRLLLEAKLVLGKKKKEMKPATKL